MNIKTGRYSNTAFVTAGSASHFGIGDGAYLPDSDAGTDLAGCYRADGGIRRREKNARRTVSMKTALTVLAVAVFIFGSMTCSRFLAVRKAQSDVSDRIARIEQIKRDNVVLSRQVETARDLSRIGYIAVTELGMVASDEGNTVVMYVPQVEAFAGTIEREPAAPDGENRGGDGEERLNVTENGRAGR